MVQILSFVKNIYIEYNYQNDLNWAISFLLLNVSVSNDKGQQNKQNLFDLDIKRKPSLWEIQCDLQSMCRCSQAVDKLFALISVTPWYPLSVMPDPGLVPASYLALLVRRCQRQTGRLKVGEGARFFLFAPRAFL